MKFIPNEKPDTTVPKLADCEQSTVLDIVQVQGINSKGYGTISKIVMEDDRLTIEAKAIYAYLCSFAGSGRTAFPQRDRILSKLKISKDRYYTHFKLLKQYGYIKVEQQYKDGKLSRNIYTILHFVDQSPDNKDTTKPRTGSSNATNQRKNTVPTDSSSTEIQCTENKDTENQDTENKDANNKKQSFKNNSSNNNQSSQSGKPDGRDDTDTVRFYLDKIRNAIDYNSFVRARSADVAIVDEIVSVMIDAICSPEYTVRIGGEAKPQELVKDILLQLGHCEIAFVVDQFKNAGQITKKRKYLLTMLFNAKTDVLPKGTGERKQQAKQNRFCNFEQRDIDFAELERKEMELLRRQKK